MHEVPAYSTVLGGPNPQLAAGAEALRQGRYREGIELTLAGLQYPNPSRDVAVAHANLCAGYAGIREFAQALHHCNESIALNQGNWRTWNNRAAAHVGLGLPDAALADVETGLVLAPRSGTLLKTLRVVNDHKRHLERQGRKAFKA